MNETSGVNLALLISAGCLESIARDVESVDASALILCGIAANRLYALPGGVASELPHITDHPRAIARLLDCVSVEFSGLDPDIVVGEVLSLVRAARRHVEEREHLRERAMRHWREWLPEQYEAIDDPANFSQNLDSGSATRLRGWSSSCCRRSTTPRRTS